MCPNSCPTRTWYQFEDLGVLALISMGDSINKKSGPGVSTSSPISD